MVEIIRKTVYQVSGVVNWLMENLIGIALIILFVVIVGEVAGRSYLGFTLPWMPEAVGFLLAFITFAGMSCWVYRRKLLAIRFLKSKFINSERASLIFDIFTWVILGGYAFLLMTVGVEFAGRAGGQYTPSRVFSLYHARLILPLGGALILFQALNNLLQDGLRVLGVSSESFPDSGAAENEQVLPDGPMET